MARSWSYKRLFGTMLYLARRLAKAAAVPESTDVDGDALGAIAMAAMALEAGVNLTARNIFPPDGYRLHTIALAFDHVMEPRWQPLERVRMLARAMGVSEPDTTVPPWSRVETLQHLRNAFVHYKSDPVSSSHALPFFPKDDLLVKLGKELGTYARFEQGGPWLEVFLNAECAAWAVLAADEALKALEREPWRKTS